MSEAPNPYAPPKHEGTVGPGPVQASPSEQTAWLEAARRDHLNAEANVKTIGFLALLGAAFSAIGGVAVLLSAPLASILLVVTATFSGYGGYMLRRLQPAGRVAITVVMCLGVLRSCAMPSVGADAAASIGAMIGALFWPLIILAILWGKKATHVMTPHYRDVVIPATPHVKRKTSLLVIILGFILLTLIVVGIAAVLIDG